VSRYSDAQVVSPTVREETAFGYLQVRMTRELAQARPVGSSNAATRAAAPVQAGQDGPSAAPCSTSQNRRLLRQAGLRATTPRLLLLTVLCEIDHPDVDVLHGHVQVRGIALTTVYRTVDALQAAGLITATVLPSGARIFHPAEAVPHAHLVCIRCASVTDLPAPAVTDQLMTGAHRVGFRLDTLDVVAQGLCRDCRALPAWRAGPDPDPAVTGQPPHPSFLLQLRRDRFSGCHPENRERP
jgi:Fe2+ or Zn2+ uptake regulation protein